MRELASPRVKRMMATISPGMPQVPRAMPKAMAETAATPPVRITALGASKRERRKITTAQPIPAPKRSIP